VAKLEMRQTTSKSTPLKRLFLTFDPPVPSLQWLNLHGHLQAHRSVSDIEQNKNTPARKVKGCFNRQVAKRTRFCAAVEEGLLF
jgi:hypothetical protein